ncbi:hypothetical protein BUE80_DR002865 [Diplocarpon rosae]|nr:hypothetical protein BUE80_DR002865 [Diplocarpon rosae]
MKSCLLILALSTVLQIAVGSPMQELDSLMRRDNCRKAKGVLVIRPMRVQTRKSAKMANVQKGSVLSWTPTIKWSYINNRLGVLRSLLRKVKAERAAEPWASALLWLFYCFAWATAKEIHIHLWESQSMGW